MVYCGCGYKTWTKIISITSIIFCLIYLGSDAFNIYLIKNFAIICDLIGETCDGNYLNENFIFPLLIVSIVFNSLWIITSIILLVYNGKREEKPFIINIYVIWVIIAMLLIVRDGVAIILDGINISKYLFAPIYMVITNSRGIIGEIINILELIGMIIVTSVVRKRLNNKPKQKTVPLKPPKSVLKNASKESHLEAENVDRVRNWYDHYDESESESTSSYMNRNMQDPPTPDVVPQPQLIPKIQEISREPVIPKQQQNNHNNNNYNHHYNTNNNYSSSSHNNYYYNKNQAPNDPTKLGLNTNVLVNGVTSGTLRRQLPWSYMSEPKKLPPRPPKKPAPPVPSISSQIPYVPAPDYMLKQYKPVARRNFNEPKWSQYL